MMPLRRSEISTLRSPGEHCDCKGELSAPVSSELETEPEQGIPGLHDAVGRGRLGKFEAVRRLLQWKGSRQEVGWMRESRIGSRVRL